MEKRLPKVILGLSLMFSTGIASAQTDSLSQNIEDISLEDLMNVKIVSASKKEESQFDASLSISSISREEIKRAGATSIMEALRLLPGLFVTESTNGNYNVSLRGFANIPAGASLNAAANSITLVMIDNRPVYNYFNGGTFWETLPVDLNDVEKIEVVRGPAAAVYGPNAAAGVINIITRRPQKAGLYTVANAQYGTQNQLISNASVGYKFKKFDFIVSGNQQHRERTQSDYYSWVNGRNMSADSIVTSFPRTVFTDTLGNPNASQRYPNRNLAMNKYGYNAFLNYSISEKSLISLALGGEEATVQKTFIDNLGTPLNTSISSTQYADLRGKFNRFSAQVSYLTGVQDEAKGMIGYKYKFSTVDANAEYDFVYKGLSIKPGVSYRRADYDDSKYAHIDTRQGFLGGAKALENYAGSLRGELNVSKFKFTAAGRVDKYNVPDKVYASYQFGTNYKITDRNLVRVVVSRAYKGPNMYDSYASNNIYVGNINTQVAPGVFMPLPYYAQVQGNTHLKLQSIDLIEIGYRLKATDKLYFDLELFNQTIQNFSYLVGQPTQISGSGSVTVIQSVENINMKAIQNGGTLSANFIFKKFQFKPFVTIQQANLKKEPLYRESVSSDSVRNISVTTNRKDNGTPNVYGGAYLNFQATSKLNINLNGYVFSNYTYVNLVNTFIPGSGVVNVNGKVILNAKVSYKFFNKLDLFVNVRNLTNSKSYEFAHTDLTKAMILGGASFEF